VLWRSIKVGSHIAILRNHLSTFFLESIRYLDVHPDLSEISPELKDPFEALLAPLLLNSALAAIRSEPPSSDVALKNATRALTTLRLNNADKGKDLTNTWRIIDYNSRWSSTAKALYRRAVAQTMLKEDGDAEVDLQQAIELIPGDQTISSELAKVRQRRKARRDKEKKAFKNLFS